VAIKQISLQRGVSVPAVGLAFDPALRVMVAGVETLVAPDIVIPVPKEAATSGAILTPMATGNITVDHNNVGAITFDILAIAFHSIQKVTTGDEKALYLSNAQSVAAAGTTLNPLLKQGGVLVAPDICIAVPKTVPSTAAKTSFVPTAMATGGIVIWSGEAGAIDNDVCMIRMHSIQRLINQVFGMSQVRTRFFTVLDTADAGLGSTFKDAADTSRVFQCTREKISGDGSLQLRCVQTAGATGPGASGNLNLYEGTGDAVIAWTAVIFEKYADLRQAVAVPNGAGLTFNPGLVVNGVAVMPDIVIPIPKVAATVPYVPTDLAGAVGNVTVQHNDGAPQLHDILSLKVVTGFRNVASAP